MKGVFDEGNYHQPTNLFVLTIISLQRIKKKKYQSLLSLMSIIKYTYFWETSLLVAISGPNQYCSLAMNILWSFNIRLFGMFC